MKPSARKALLGERKALLVRLNEINSQLAEHEREVIAARRALRREVPPPRAAIKCPDVAIVRQYAREHMGRAQVFNDRRADYRRVKIWRTLSPAEIAMHSAGILALLPHASIKLASSPFVGARKGEGQCLCVILPVA